MSEIAHYLSGSGHDFYQEWLDRLKDRSAKARVTPEPVASQQGLLATVNLSVKGAGSFVLITGRDTAFITHKQVVNWCCCCLVQTSAASKLILKKLSHAGVIIMPRACRLPHWHKYNA